MSTKLEKLAIAEVIKHAKMLQEFNLYMLQKEIIQSINTVYANNPEKPPGFAIEAGMRPVIEEWLQNLSKIYRPILDFSEALSESFYKS